MLSALMMLRRVLPALRYAFSEEEFGPIFGAGILLVDRGQPHVHAQPGLERRRLVLLLGVDAHHDERLGSRSHAQDGWLKVFTVLYQLVGIGILVEILRRLGIAFITIRAREKSSHHRGDAPGSA